MVSLQSTAMAVSLNSVSVPVSSFGISTLSPNRDFRHIRSSCRKNPSSFFHSKPLFFTHLYPKSKESLFFSPPLFVQPCKKQAFHSSSSVLTLPHPSLPSKDRIITSTLTPPFPSSFPSFSFPKLFPSVSPSQTSPHPLLSPFLEKDRQSNYSPSSSSTRSVQLFAKSDRDSDLSPEKALPLPMTYPDSSPLSPEAFAELLSCNPDVTDCKDVIYQWTDKCRRCFGTGFVSYSKKGRREVTVTCLACTGIGYVRRFTTRDDIPVMEDIDES